jgi:hypothetical protein
VSVEKQRPPAVPTRRTTVGLDGAAPGSVAGRRAARGAAGPVPRMVCRGAAATAGLARS